ncbi:MAG: hypothetical protein ABIJ21_05790 [Nanoarchaeota archaeon]
MYDIKKDDAKQPVQDAGSVLEEIAKAYTRMDEVSGEQYGIDNCNCGNCYCLKGNLLLILSPVGIAATASAFGPISAAH